MTEMKTGKDILDNTSDEIDNKLSSIPKSDQLRIKRALSVARKEMEKPLRIAIIGQTGSGKTTTINNLFGVTWPTDPGVASTKNFQEITIPSGADNRPITFIDFPGLGESRGLNVKYLELYKEKLPDCHAILWVIAATDRHYFQIQSFISQLASVIPNFYEIITFGINAIDKVYPENWNIEMGIPSLEQERNIIEIRATLLENIRFMYEFEENAVISYSALYAYELQALRLSLVERAGDHGWILNSRAQPIKSKLTEKFDEWKQRGESNESR